MEFHDTANIFPMMQDDEYAALVEDIRTNGLLEPIWTHEGKIVDGRNRWEACQELGIAPRFREWSGQGSLVAFVVSLNVTRRHLSSGQKAVVALEVEKQMAAEAARRVGGRPRKEVEKPSQTFDQVFRNGNSNHNKAAHQAASIVGTNRQYISDAKQIQRDAPELLDLIRDSVLSLPDAKKLSRMTEEDRGQITDKIESGEARTIKRALKQIKAEAQAAIPADLPNRFTDRCQFYCGDIADVSDYVEDESVDVIITDPPYPREYLPLYETLASVAARVLKPGGSLLCMIGQSYLPEILTLMTPHIDYHWTVSYLTPGGQATQLWERKVNSFWKPVLWFVKGKYQGHWAGDVAKSDVNDNDKRFHHWGQSESGMADLMGRFTVPGQVVFDPFMGGGTTALVAVQMNRRFIGIDIRLDALETTLRRLGEWEEERERPSSTSARIQAS